MIYQLTTMSEWTQLAQSKGLTVFHKLTDLARSEDEDHDRIDPNLYLAVFVTEGRKEFRGWFHTLEQRGMLADSMVEYANSHCFPPPYAVRDYNNIRDRETWDRIMDEEGLFVDERPGKILAYAYVQSFVDGSASPERREYYGEFDVAANMGFLCETQDEYEKRKK